MAFVHDSLGPTANSIFAGALATLALLLTIARLRRRGFGIVAVLVVATIALLDAGTLVSVGPAAVEVLGVGLLLWLLDEWRVRALSSRDLAASVPLLMLAWANTHGSFVLGLGLLGATWIGVVSQRDGRTRLFLAIGMLAALVTLVNPFGLRLWEYVATAVTGSRLQLITEWAPPNLGDRMWWAFVVALGLAAVGAAGWLARPRQGGPGTLRIDDVLIAVALAIAGLEQARHAGVLGIGAAPVVAAGVAWVGRRLPALPARTSRTRPGLHVAIFGALAIATGILVWARVGPTNTAAAVRADYPVDALPALDRLACGRPDDLHLFNDYSWGGWLEMVRPDIPVFIDGRSEVYGDAQVAGYAVIAGAQAGWDAALDAPGVETALVRSASPLVGALAARGWTVAYRDAVSTLLRRNPVLTECRAIVLFH